MRAKLLTLLVVLITPAHAGVISIVIDDLGYSQSLGTQAVQLPAAVTLSVLPATPYADTILKKAKQRGHEVMLHLPMQAKQPAPQEPNMLTITMSELELKNTLSELLTRYPDIAGVNNHMGSRLTSSPSTMAWLMQTLAEQDNLFFLDSRTTADTIAEITASEYLVPTTRRDIFLDNSPNSYDDITHQLRRLSQQAKDTGFALAIGHPNALTLEVLEAELPKILSDGVELLPVSEYIKRKNARRDLTN